MPSIACAQALPANASLPELEARLKAIDAELATLPNPSMRSGIGSIGYRSQWHEDAVHREWIEIDLGGEFPIDEIILTPIVWRDSKGGFRADAFPQDFVIRAGLANDRSGTVVAQSSSHGAIPIGNAPWVIPIEQTTASWVRLETSELPQRASDKNYVLQLSEMLVFSGSENVALRRPVTTSSVSPSRGKAWNPQYLTDGLVPYLMDAAGGHSSLAYLTRPATEHILTLDLGKSYPLSRIHLHTVEQSDTVPQALAGDIGILTPLKILGANRSDFSDAVPLLEVLELSLLDIGPIMMWPIRETTCRYIRIIAKKSGDAHGQDSPAEFGFAEIELFSQGRNIALGKQFNNSAVDRRVHRPVSALTDGNNLYGTILPVRTWLEALAQRHALEVERPLVSTALQQRYTAQKIRLRQMSWLAVILVLGVGLFILIERLLHRRAVERLRTRFAADLHDELGANLHVIGMLGNLAQRSANSADTLHKLHDRICEMTERTSQAVRYCTNMLEAKGLYDHLIEDMQRFTRRILADIDYTFTFEGENYLLALPPRTRADLFLFFKECLVNISRHSQASECHIDLSATSRQLCLTVKDNGRGLKEIDGYQVPHSLKRRARLLRAKVTVTPNTEGGTSVQLTRKLRRQFFSHKH
ncbi:hypothetical protein SH580_00790 [Coraliomargarita algicola]|uniref:histidine kinase n=1 Tax=Coraliomargarita algicola TaxID=3092156 RepID=A0ABZ0RL34_9BACT|nr:histidine kinase [Coraliomargarita sp. J2-16]WPJ96237.1 hypothetical protein SH580_00790 [Coraliomargarita sp. J2-16]